MQPTNTNETNIKQVEQLVEQTWPTATTEKREKLVRLMVAFESPEWDKYLFAAEKTRSLAVTCY